MMLSAFWPFYQFLWTIYFVTMFLVGFWCIFMFFGFVIPLWLTEGLKEYFGKVKPFDPEDIRRKLITEQEGVEVIFNQPKGHGPFIHDSHGHNHGHH
ncbi:hypothetical protein LNP04_10190 [Chryseobacterium sp. C-71]|uniref:hypothetical protein n=1 Tax=Chryseobacterium sp. C-71 TaxID=2893882 RepID=UPI001E3A7D3A|nr:hypothetical protein [Chryseobacterium sp. C-71]UFH30351.1 hypothetical protein LNP04_10190 [Chryseobacterium sp. C-71]